MKTVHILSYPLTTNYGGLLQLYSLNVVLSEQFNVSIISYKNQSSVKKTFISKILSFFYRKIFKFLSVDNKRKLNEDEFKKKMPLTSIVYKSQEDLSTIKTDYFVVGSDQVWNPFLNGFDVSYLFGFKTNASKISYAASFGLSDGIPERWSKLLNTYLPEFKNVSLREKSGLNFISNIKNKNVTIDLDPTLLLDKEYWVNNFCNTKAIFNNYVLVYLMPCDRKMRKFIISNAKKISKNINMKLVVIGMKNIWKLSFIKHNYYHAGPAEFVNLIYNANFVFTNSFHGTAFSVNLNKDFYSFINASNLENNLSCRVIDFLNALSLSDRIIEWTKNTNKSINNESVDYTNVNLRLSELRDTSRRNLFYAFKE